MNYLIGSFIGLVLSVSVGAEPLLEGRIRLSSGQPAVGVQVRLFDLTDLRRFVGTTTDESGHFALPLRAFSTTRGTALPTDFALGQNYPNPFNPSTIIPYQLPTAGHVRLEVFNLLGQRVATLVDGERPAGVHTAQWDATDAAGRAVGAGVYIYRLSSGGQTESRRMVLVDGQAGIPKAATLRPVQSAVESTVEADGPVYGLTVSGEGLMPYVNPNFRVGVDEVDIVIEEHSSARMKLTSGGVLGDVDSNGQVDMADALFVAMYSLDPSIVLPNNGDISRGDVNGDGMVDVGDAVLLLRYLINPSDPALPPGIGKSKEFDNTLVGDGSGIFLTRLTRNDGGHWFTRWSPDGELIAFVSGRDRNPGIYVMFADGSDPVNLTQNASDWRPEWSPDGERIAFESERDGNSEIYVLSGGYNPVNLTQNASNDWRPQWSPDGQRIAFVSERDGNREVYVMFADGSNPVNLTQNASNDWGPQWSPDGQRIAFVSERDGNLEVYVMSADGSNPVNLTQNASDDWRPQWSPDGQFITFESERDGNSEIYLIKISLLFAEMRETVDLPSTLSQIYWTEGNLFNGIIRRANSDGSVETVVTGVLTLGLALDVAGGQIYWTGINDEEEGSIYRADLDGSNVETVLSRKAWPVSLALDVAGSQIYWIEVSDEGGIYRADLDGSNVEILISWEVAGTLALDVAGNRMYGTASESGDGGIYRAPLDEPWDESNFEVLVSRGEPNVLALDVAEGQMYWTDDDDLGYIYRADLDGSSVEVLLSGVSGALGLALDVVGNQMYWTNPDEGLIYRADLDGSNVEVLLSGLEEPTMIVLAP